MLMFAALAARPIVNRVICSLRRRLSRLYYSTESSCPTACDAVLMRQLNSGGVRIANRSEEHTSELQSLMRISYAVVCLKKKKHNAIAHLKKQHHVTHTQTRHRLQQ